jgi:GTP cyclohydrolase-4
MEMADRSGVVYEHENARDAGEPVISLSEHRRVIAEARDVPEEVPSFRMALSEVGISGKTVWIRLREGHLPFQAAVGVALPRDVRGIHMSRIEEAISQLHERFFPDPRHYAAELSRLVLGRQLGDTAWVRLVGKIPLLRRTSVSGRSSVDAVEISAEAEASRSDDGVCVKTVIGARVSHMTACPCTQVYNGALFPGSSGHLPPPTHSQRSVTALSVEEYRGSPSYGEILDCLEAALHVTQDLMKRPDEAEMVLKAHREPQFVEDTTRGVAREIGLRFGVRLPADARIIIETLSLESIHIHDVRCVLRTTVGEILGAL